MYVYILYTMSINNDRQLSQCLQTIIDLYV